MITNLNAVPTYASIGSAQVSVVMRNFIVPRRGVLMNTLSIFLHAPSAGVDDMALGTAPPRVLGPSVPDAEKEVIKITTMRYLLRLLITHMCLLRRKCPF